LHGYLRLLTAPPLVIMLSRGRLCPVLPVDTLNLQTPAHTGCFLPGMRGPYPQLLLQYLWLGWWAQPPILVHLCTPAASILFCTLRIPALVLWLIRWWVSHGWGLAIHTAGGLLTGLHSCIRSSRVYPASCSSFRYSIKWRGHHGLHGV
jgi:hypothetical protein